MGEVKSLVGKAYQNIDNQNKVSKSIMIEVYTGCYGNKQEIPVID